MTRLKLNIAIWMMVAILVLVGPWVCYANEIPQSVSEHWDVLWLLAVALASALCFVLWTLGMRILNRIESKLDQSSEEHSKCQLELTQKYALLDTVIKSVTAIEKERKEMWRDYFFPHTHFPTGEVRVNHNILKRSQFNVDEDK